MTILTDGRSGTIAKAEIPAKGRSLIFDEHRNAPAGFGLKVTPAGKRSFVYRYSIDGARRMKTIGDWPAWPLEAARAEAREWAVRIQKGDDPLEEEHTRRREPKVADLAEEWMALHVSGLKSRRAVESMIRNDLLPAIGRMKVSDVRRRHVIGAIELKAETAPRLAAQLLIYARQLFDFAATRDFIAANPLAGLKPSAIKVQGKRSPLAARKRTRVLDDDEVRSFWTRIDAVGVQTLTGICLKLILVTGQRPGEVAGMRLDEIAGRWWTIPAARRGKTETAQDVYLCDMALGLIAEARDEIERLAPRRGRQWHGHVFEAANGKAITPAALCRAVQRNAEALGSKVDPEWGVWRPHDLRRTMRTGLSACKVRPDIAEMVIGHEKGGILAVYDRHGFEAERKAAMEAWERRLGAIIAGTDHVVSDNVIALEPRS